MDVAQPLERITHLLLFVLELDRVGQALPAAAAAPTEMGAESGQAVGRRLEQFHQPTLGEPAFDLGQDHAGQVAGHGAIDEHDEIVHASYPLAAEGQSGNG